MEDKILQLAVVNRARRQLVQWANKVQNHLALIHSRLALITAQAAGVLG